MAKQSAAKVLERWLALDAALAGGGLHVPTFAREWGVSTRTVRRDLAAFRALGQEPRGRKARGGKYWWYARPPLLARTHRAYLQRQLGRDVTVAELEGELWQIGRLLRELRKRGKTLLWLNDVLFLASGFYLLSEEQAEEPVKDPAKAAAHTLGEVLWKGLRLAGGG
jgi:hypothetical protein